MNVKKHISLFFAWVDWKISCYLSERREKKYLEQFKAQQKERQKMEEKQISEVSTE